MTIHSSSELKSVLLPKIKQAIGVTQSQIYNIIDDLLQRFYEEYTPEQYKRTYQLLRSLVVTKIEETTNGYKAIVYFDYTKLKYKDWSGGKEMEFGGVRGLHGYRGKDHSIPIKGTAFWSDSKKEIDNKVIDMLIANLKSAGIPIK